MTVTAASITAPCRHRSAVNVGIALVALAGVPAIWLPFAYGITPASSLFDDLWPLAWPYLLAIPIAAAPVIDGGVLMSVAWNRYLDKYVAIYTPSLSSLMFVRTADRPEGPWSQEIVIEGVPPAVGFTWIGSGVGHPELAREGGRIELLTYARHLLAAGSETRAVEIEFRKR